MEKEKVMEFQDFSFLYQDGKDGVFDINLTIRKGEFVVLTGQSGCGKTTLTRCMNGLIPDFYEGTFQGKSVVCGMEMGKHETGDYAGYVGSVFQDPRSQFFTLGVRTEISFPSENLGMARETMQQRYIETVEKMQIEDILQRGILSLSSGEKQKVAVASVYTAGVSVYVLDEPSANLDWQGTMQLAKVLSVLKEKGCTIIVSEHRLHYLKDLADRIVMLEKGRITADLSKEKINNCSSEWFREHKIRQIDLSGIKSEVPKIGEIAEKQTFTAENLSFWYQRGEVLWKNVNVSCESGAIIGLVGKNGSGKSTMLQVLMGLKKAKDGKIYINGKKISKRQLREQSFYMMQDADYQFLTNSVMDEMLAGQKQADAEQRATKILAYYGLEAYADTHPSVLSGGQKQRLSMALLEMSDKQLLFFDEPTSGLDAANMEIVRKSMIRLAEKGRILFVITHDYEFAASLFTALLVFKEGETVNWISPEEYQPKQLMTIMKNGGKKNE